MANNNKQQLNIVEALRSSPVVGQLQAAEPHLFCQRHGGRIGLRLDGYPDSRQYLVSRPISDVRQ